MKKILTSILAFLCVLTACLFVGGCSCGGDIVNCLTNCLGNAFDVWGNCNDCQLNRTCFHCSTCGFFSESGCFDCYDSLAVSSCYGCAEQCRSFTCSDETSWLGDSDLYQIETESSEITSVQVLSRDYIEKKESSVCLKITGEITIKFVGEGVKFDNVSIVCKLEYGDYRAVTSTRWIGSAKCDKSYTVKPEFYLGFDVQIYSDEIYESSYYTLDYHVVGEEVS